MYWLKWQALRKLHQHTTRIQFYADMHAVCTASNPTTLYHFPLVHKYFRCVCVCLRACACVLRSMFFFRYTHHASLHSQFRNAWLVRNSWFLRWCQMCCGCDLKSKWLMNMCVINMILSEVLSSAAIGRNANSTKHTAYNFSTFLFYCGSCNFKFSWLVADFAFNMPNTWKRQ